MVSNGDSHNSFINDNVIDAFLKTAAHDNCNIIVVPTQIYLQISDASNWECYVSQYRGYADRMATHGQMYGYRRYVEAIQDNTKIMIIPINFDLHWMILVRHHHGK